MTNIETSKHYNGEITIKFYPDSHRYQLEGEKTYLIGVTTATSILDKSRPLLIWASNLSKAFLLEALSNRQEITPDLIHEAVNQHQVKKETAATSGSLVHDWAEQFIKGKCPEVPNDENVRNGVLAFLKWVNTYGVKFIASEKRVYSKKHKYVGTLDCIFTLESECHKIIHLGDFKTSNNVYMEMVMQVAAYQEAEAEEHGTVYGDKYILRFDKDTGNFESHCFPASYQQAHFNAFLSCLKLKEIAKQWDREYGQYAKKRLN